MKTKIDQLCTQFVEAWYVELFGNLGAYMPETNTNVLYLRFFCASSPKLCAYFDALRRLAESVRPVAVTAAARHQQ